MPNNAPAINADGISEPFAAAAVPVEHEATGERFASRGRHLGHHGGASHVGVIIEELDPGKQPFPPHYHMLEEEHCYILEGALTARLGDRAYIMQAGDYICWPAGQKVGHSLYNHTDKVCRYLIIGERNPHDVIFYPESGRVGVRLTEEGYSTASTMGYWDGIDTGSRPQAKG